MRHYPEFGYLSSRDLDMLTRVLEMTSPEGASESERQARAATLVRLFQSGLTTEEALIAEVGRPSS
jgi:hypothetical protein